MSIQHETPLVIWSNRSGPVKDVGSVSPSLLPLHVLKAAGISHPYYTGFLGEIAERYRVIDRNLLVTPGNEATLDWARAKSIDPSIRDFRLLQYDMIFGKRHAEKTFFPQTPEAPGTS
jgi:phosphoglycerol transferase MdoB-like AlkP superfamily enzyme